MNTNVEEVNYDMLLIIYIHNAGQEVSSAAWKATKMTGSSAQNRVFVLGSEVMEIR